MCIRDSCGMGSFFKTGDYFGAEMLYKTIPDELDPYDHKAFLDNPTKFYAVVTNCETCLLYTSRCV